MSTPGTQHADGSLELIAAHRLRPGPGRTSRCGDVAKAGHEASSYEMVDAPTFARAVANGNAHQVLDVRSRTEWSTGSLPGALSRYVPDFADGLPSELDATQRVWVLCASGFRASIAAGSLQDRGYAPIVLANGGVADVLGHIPV